MAETTSAEITAAETTAMATTLTETTTPEMKEKRWDIVRRARMELAIDAAKKLFLSRKIENVKMTEIADQAGFGVASLYRYFATKEAIAIAVATELWRELKADILPVFQTQAYQKKSGIDRISAILDIYSDILDKKKDFLLFLADFDAFCLKQKIQKEQLKEYESSIHDFYLPYMDALEQGKKDGTIQLRGNPEILYLTINHALLALMERIAAGEILSQDQYGREEIQMMKDMILYFYRT